MYKQMDKAAQQSSKCRFKANLLHPEVKNSFWVCLMGKGYPSPRNRFRWCTERMKIKPANQFIRQIVRHSGEDILVLGTRKAESSKRAATMEKQRQWRVRDRLKLTLVSLIP